jgi:sugar phosphate isomerase/epimerase
MQLGIFAKTFVRPTVEQTLDAVVANKLDCIQFNFACAGSESMPRQIDPILAKRIGSAARERRIRMAAVSGTFNMIHPDAKQRADGFRRLEVIAAGCHILGTNLITLCTGTRDPEDMWRAHPDNDSADAWRALISAINKALEMAEKYDLSLGIEPELANVINSAPKARRLLDEIKSPRLKIIMDGANLLHADQLPQLHAIWKQAFDLLGENIAIAHAKDLAADGRFTAAGKGALDYALYIRLLRSVNFGGPLILHGLSEAEVDASTRLLRHKLNDKP